MQSYSEITESKEHKIMTKETLTLTQDEQKKTSIVSVWKCARWREVIGQTDLPEVGHGVG